MANHRLPPDFTSLYRLFLRATSASVLHKGSATRSLRRLFRPAFEVAARNVKKLQGDLLKDAKERTELENWMETFQKRMDNNLSLLYTSAMSRGLPHRLTSTLSRLSTFNYNWSMRRYLTPLRPWNPQLPPDSPEYKAATQDRRNRKRDQKMAQQRDIDDRAWGALGEVIRMAEGRDGLVLSRVRFTKRGGRQ